MAGKRMFRLDVLETDAFMDMPLTTQALYFHLNLRADDDGFIGNPKQITRNIGASNDDLNLLIAKRFVIQFEDGVIVVKHWRMHNTLSKDRYHETKYLENKSMLLLKDNGAYSMSDGKPIDDQRLKQIATRQKSDRRTKDEQKTNDRRTIDERKTTTEKEEEVDIDINNTNGVSSKAPEDAETIFEALWKLYPKKKGKGQVSKTQKSKIAKVGFDEMARAVERYKQSVAGKDQQYTMYGSTFFNSGYVDYLDANYEEETRKFGFEVMA